ncbi:acyltransferase family protein [Pseudomonas veronii]|uniref:acyltransferase family protein n=1 Tax=Pseudomonas TaxID=286 RepID=UPI001304D933|nr:acyltransferase [Pseudomonas sp. GV105]
MHNKSEILPLTGLRFIAAIYVFVFHINYRWPIFSGGILKEIVSQGAVGMTIFFVLSGLLLAYQYSDRYEDRKHYFLRRLARIYPIYVVAAISTLPWIWGAKIGVQTISWVDTTFLVLANVFVVQAWVPSFFKFWNDSGSWSISVEVFCYVVLPFIAPWMSRLSSKGLWLFAVFLYLCSVIPGNLIRLFPELSFPFIYALPVFRLPEFLLGVCGFLAIQRGFKFARPNFVLVFILAVFVIYIGPVNQITPYVGHNWIVVPMVVLTVMALMQSSGMVSRAFSSRLFVWLGKISYCFYSFQVFLLFMLVTFHSDLVGLMPALRSNWVLCVFAMLVLVVISACGYHFIEEPCRRKIQSWADGRVSRHVCREVLKT